MIKRIKTSDRPAEDEKLSAEERVLSLVEHLTQELNPNRRIDVSLKSSLQRDLGIDSLGLSELLLRIEKEFKIRLPDDLIARIEPPGDIAREVAMSPNVAEFDVARKGLEFRRRVISTKQEPWGGRAVRFGAK